MPSRERRSHLGLKPGVTVAQLEQAIHEKRAEELLNWLNVYTGDMIYVAGGTVHTLGPGSVIVETQQQSDTTYRLYDYGRPRELAPERRPGRGKVESCVRKSGAAGARRKLPAAATGRRRWWLLPTLLWICLR